MPIDPSLITDTLSRWQSPQAFTMPDPLAQYAKIQALKNGLLQQQTQGLQLQAAQQAAAQQQRDLNDQQVLQQVAQDPATMKAITSWDGQSPFPLAGRGLQFKTMQDIQSKVLTDQKAALDWTTAQRNANEAKLARVGKVLPGLMYDENGKPRDDATIAANAPGLISQLQSEGVLTGPVPPITSFADAQKYALQHGYMEGINNYAQSAAKAAAEPGLVTAQSNEAQAKADQAKQEAQKTKNVNDAMAAAKANPQQGAALIDAAIPPGVDQQANNAYKAAWQAAMSVGNLDGAAQIVATAAGHAASLSPAVRAADAAKAAAIARATLPVEQAKSLYQNALNQGDKATQDYASTISDSRQTAAAGSTIQKVITLAQGDNATAGAQLKALIPELTNAMQNIKRPGNAQSSQISSVLENAIGEIKSGVGLSPVTKKAINDIRPYVDAVVNGAVINANGQIDATNTAYGKKFAHETLPVQYHQNPKTGQTIVSRDGGITWTDTKTGESVQ